MMNIENIKSNVSKFCNQYRVKSLDLFGSFARGNQSKASDMDFLVEFEDSEPKEYSRRFFGLLHSLEDTFHCNIDLLTSSSIKKKTLRRKIERDRISLYER